MKQCNCKIKLNSFNNCTVCGKTIKKSNVEDWYIQQQNKLTEAMMKQLDEEISKFSK